MKHFMAKFKRKDQGQGIMEYIILSSLVGIFCLIAVKQFGAVVKRRIQIMKEEIVRNIP